MDKMKDVNDFTMCSDVATRMALFAMAKALTPEEIKSAFNEINRSLTVKGGYEAEKLTPLTEVYKSAALQISESLA